MTSEAIPWEELAARIRAKATDIPQKVVAARLGLKEGTLSRYLNGKREPSPGMAHRIAAEFGVDLGQLARPDLALDPGVLARLDALSRQIAEGFTRLERSLTAPPAPPAGVADSPARPAGTPLRLLPYEPESSADEPREIHETEIPLVSYVAAGTGEVEAVTGETVLVNNTIARKVQAGEGFVARVLGDSMEDELSAGDLVYFKHASADQIPDGAIVYVVYDGRDMVKVIRFDRVADGTRAKWRLVSVNPDRKKHPTIRIRKWFKVVGWAQERVDKGLGARRFKNLEE